MSPVQSKPVRQFAKLFRLALKADPLWANACALATATKKGRPSVRVVLFKGLYGEDFAFFTNYHSRKSAELIKNPYAAVAFHWVALGKQVRIEGRVKKLSRADSEAYFATRPRDSQLGAWASHQSHAIAGRTELEARYRRFKKLFEGREVPCPPNWGGFRIIPDRIEFWTNRQSRMHDRLVYTRKGERWTATRLAP